MRHVEAQLNDSIVCRMIYGLAGLNILSVKSWLRKCQMHRAGYSSFPLFLSRLLSFAPPCTPADTSMGSHNYLDVDFISVL